MLSSQLSQKNTSPITPASLSSVNKVPSNWCIAKGFTENIGTIKSTPNSLVDLNINEPKISDSESLITLKNVIKKILLNNNHEHLRIGVAIYGFSAPQLKSCRFIRSMKPEKSITTIANLNRELDLTKLIFNYEDLSIENIYYHLHKQLDLFIEALSKNKPKYIPNFNDRYLEACLYLWKIYVNENSHKIDIFKYIKSKNTSIEDKSKTIYKLIIKNTPESVDAKKLHDFIIDNEIMSCKSLSDFKKKIIELNHNEKLNSKSTVIGLFELIQNHLFRNTSKVGLDFFNEKFFSILMTWNDENTVPLSLETIRQKAFKQGKRRSFDGKNHVEPITFSEIRHLDKNKEKFANNIVRMITNDTQAAFSLGLDGHWGIYEKAEFLPKVVN